MMNKKGLYIHIPFCHKICSYCDFCKRVSNINQINKYIDYLIKEIDLYQEDNFSFDQIDTIYIGGGTPSMIGLTNLEKLLKRIDKLNINYIEYTIEINPEDLTITLIDLLFKYHITRVSIGVQTLSEKLLRIINRDFNFERFKQAYLYLKTKIPNINIDLMYAIPNQTLDDLEDSINKILAIEPTHLSIYSLIIEPKTIIYHQLEIGEIETISEDLEMEMVSLIHKLIFPKYKQYEISNYCLKADADYRSIHNLKYWHNEEYLGLGLNASSYLINRFKNVSSLKLYYALIDQNKIPIDKDSIEIIDISENKKYEIIMGLRLIEGINILDYHQKYNSFIFDDFKNIPKLIEEQYLILDNNQLFINPDYLYLMNTILIKII